MPSLDIHLALPAAALAGTFLALLVLEQASPLRGRKHLRSRRYPVNLALAALSLLVAVFVVAPVSLALSGWVVQHRFGIVHLLNLGSTARMGLGLLLMDLSFYYWHRANHTVPLFWRFHLVHHIDPDLDVTTAFRFHFGEVLLSTAFRSLQVALIGVSPLIFLVYEMIFQLNTVIQHSNLRLPIQMERLLNLLLVTPRMHGIHHSVVREETNANYSVVLSCWDRMHDSLRLNVPQRDIVVGVAAYLSPEDQRLRVAMWLPFRKMRYPWRDPDGTEARRDRSGDARRLLP